MFLWSFLIYSYSFHPFFLLQFDHISFLLVTRTFSGGDLIDPESPLLRICWFFYPKVTFILFPLIILFRIYWYFLKLKFLRFLVKRKKIIVNSFEKNKKRKTKNLFGYHFYFILFFVLKIKFLNSTFLLLNFYCYVVYFLPIF